MQKRRLLCLIGVFLAVGSDMPVLCHGLFWRFLGETRIRKGADHERIQVDGRQGPFRAVQLRVRGDDFFCERIVVNYGDGASQELVVGGRISTEGANRVIDLRDGPHLLKSVEFWYFKEPWADAPHVTLYGTR